MDCIEWSKSTTTAGYGKFKRKGVTYLAHRQAYADANNLQYSDLKGKVVLHKCDNPRCINPLHLQLGTQMENIHDMVDKQRHVHGTSVHTSKLTPIQVNEIRRDYVKRSTTHGSVALGKKYGVSHRTIISVILSQSWTLA